MKLLAIDTSTEACSAALSVDGQVESRYAEKARAHTSLIVPMIRELLEGDDLETLDAVVVGNGPGSFIGMRIAASLAQGLAFAAGRPLIAVSSLLAVAEAVFAERQTEEVLVTQDAHMKEVYLGRFVRSAEGVVEPAGPERLQAIGPIEGLEAGVRRVAAGAGWQRYPGLLEANAALVEIAADFTYPSAEFLLPSAERRLRAGERPDPADLEPAYLRQDVAKPPS